MDTSSETEQDCNDGEDNASSNGGPTWNHPKKHHILPWQNRLFYEVNHLRLLVYKEAFMKAHPDFKWYKLPPPPARTLFTRPSNSRGYMQNERNGHKADTCGISLGKLVDDEQLGGLSSLINTAAAGPPVSSTDCSSPQTSPMAQKGVENLLKPPKKRYLINGEFQSGSDAPSVDNRDFQTRDACSALLEFAELCTSNAALEKNCTSSDSSGVNNSILYSPTLLDNNKFSSLHNNSSTLSVHDNSSDNLNHQTEDLQQDQPLDLCKNKDKVDLCRENSKTITTSHQQLIDHFVDKFLCDTPVPPNKFYKSEIIDPAFYKLLSEKNICVPSSSKEDKISHSAFTLSVAIESAVDKAYSKDSSKSSSKIPESNVVLDCVSNESNEFSIRFKVEDDKKKNINHQKNEPENIAKLGEQTLFKHRHKKYSAESISVNRVKSPTAIKSQTSKQTSDANVSENSSSKFFCKLISPPKKSSVWCNIFMNEQLSKNSIDTSSHISDSLESVFPSPARRSSQRTCKGRRYQALITEGLLQSHKERKQGNTKRTVPSVNKSKNKLVTENSIFPSLKKKKKKESLNKSKFSAESYALDKSVFNLEEKIASLPKCNFDHLSRKKQIILESSSNSINSENANDFPATSTANHSCTSDIIESPHFSSSGRYKTGNFDLEQQIASLPKCNIDSLSMKKKME
ncbi:hypothetical protein HNY73_005679 [Argiope bruennichi]|uniref:Uncharacterized protein n=1 Tax=Argiope bruennichi TaxID=94029 RepID=A0A8T0FJY1_ARGBR|nr:hypothetical protein HNY73_005679 [Argiope bruennichi]